MARISFVVVGKCFIRLQHIKIYEAVQKSNSKIISKKLKNTTINLASYLFRAHILVLLASFFMHFVIETFANGMNRKRLTFFLCSIS